MADVSYEELFWQVRAELPGVPLPLLLLNYAESVREFTARSLAWQYNVDSLLDLAADTAWPTVTPGTHIPTDTYTVQPVKVKWSDGSVIPFRTRDQLDEINSTWEADTSAEPDYWTITSPGVFRVVPLLLATQTAVIRLRLAIAPIAGAVAIPEELVNEFQGAWKNGTLARLLKIPGKDWTNLQLAASYKMLFDTDITEAKSRAAADYGRPHRTVVYGGLSIGGSGRRNDDDYGR
jgi:hypothetical protein